MKIEYRILTNESYNVEGFKRHRSSQSKIVRAFFLCTRILGVLILSFASWLMIKNGAIVFALICLAALIFILFGNVIDVAIFKKNSKKSPYHDCNLVITFTEESIHTKSEMVDMQLEWSAFTKVKILNDGVLLLQGPRLYNWLPDKSISDENQLTEFRDLLERNIVSS